ncbi:MAG TPA: PAS domain S-box protein [Spirochaetia bacterium]|nr:PAS domain S-box protein [Spirochaetia bacterium]
MSKGETSEASTAADTSLAFGSHAWADQLLSRPYPVFVFRCSENGAPHCLGQNDAAAGLVDGNATAVDRGIPASSPAADPQIGSLLRACARARGKASRHVVWRSLRTGDERLMALTAEFIEPDRIALSVEDLGAQGESRRKLAFMHALAETSASCTSRSAFVDETLRLLRGYLGSDDVGYLETSGEEKGTLEIRVQGEEAVLGALRFGAADSSLDHSSRDFLQTVGLLMGETLQRIDHRNLRENIEDYLPLLAASEDSAIFLFDVEGRILTWSAAAGRIYGYDAAEVVGKYLSILYTEEDVARGKPEDDLRQAREKGSLEEEQATRKRKDGELFVVSAKTISLIDTAGRLRGYARIVRDITIAKRNETELHRNLTALDKRMRELRCLYEVAALISDQALPLSAVMKGVAELVALAYQYPHITCARIRVGDDIYETEDFVETEWEQTSTIGTLSSHLGTLQVCYRAQRPEADEGPFSEEERDLIESIGQLLGDFLERRMTADALRTTNALLETLFASTNYKIALLDNDLRYLRVNDAYAASWRRKAYEYAGRSHLEFFPDDEQVFRDVLRTGTPYIAADKLRETRDENGNPLLTYWDWELFPMSGEGMAGLVLILVDRTRRHRARKDLESSREELRKLASHLQELREEERKIIAREIHDELGGLLTALKMEISLLGRGDSGAGGCLDSYDSALGLVDQSISMVQRITSNLRPRILDDFGLVPAMEWHVKDYQKRSGIPCILKTGGGRLSMEKDRAAAVFRIFQEALTNIARHANASAVNISLRKAGGKLRMRVSDNGVGIDESRVVAPSSYGLMGMRERAQSLGGQVSIHGSRGRGTTLELEIPLSSEVGA